MDRNKFVSLGFDLSYLALLTKSNLKRLSRWEGGLSPDQEQVLRDLGLGVTRLKRRLRFGRKAEEVVFALKDYYRDLYYERFHLTRIKESPGNMRLKGFLFGYPSCCVEAFVRDRYARNGLVPRDQRILFHWACPACKTTPTLLREYRSIHDECLRIFREVEPAGSSNAGRSLLPAGVSLALRRMAAPVALGLSAMLLLPHVGAAYRFEPGRAGLRASDNPHLLPVEDDADGDYLSYGEEILRGLNTWNDDTNYDGVIDGVEEALLLHGLISALPDTVQTDRPYKVNHLMRGVEYCEVCGACENMGFVQVVSPLRSLSVDIPYICLHYLEHGSLSYAGTEHPSGRLDLAQIKRVLLATDESHLTCAYYHYDDDPDEDGLGSREEAMLATDPGAADTDHDSVKDGPQFVEDLLEALSGLPREARQDQPYLIEHPVYGIEACDSCGAIFNMGFVEITNPLEGLSLEIPFIGLHYLAHGSCAYHGTVNAGRVLPTVLRTILMGTGTSHWLAVESDTDADGLKDVEEPYFSLDPGIKDTDGDGIPDGPELAMAMAQVIGGLPDGPQPDKTYVNHWEADGYVHCLICGQSVNMGMMEIINPVAGTSCNISYINHHYMEHGSFFGDYPELSRSDPRDLDAVLEMSSNVTDPDKPLARLPLMVYPNPFRQATNIVCGLTHVNGMGLAIYDASGRQVRDLSGSIGADLRLVWDGTDANGRRLPAGIYFCRANLDGLKLSKKIVLLK